MKNPLSHPSAPRIFLAHVCAITVILVFGIALGLAEPYFPMIEGMVRPVTTSELDPASTIRDDTRACYTMRLHKVHAGEPIVYQFSVEVRQNEHWLRPLDVNAHVIDEKTGASRDDYSNHPPGTTWRRRWCFDLPASIAPWQVIRVSGYGVHRVHPLWDTNSPTPSFVIPGVASGEQASP